jgi:hypothetical protein
MHSLYCVQVNSREAAAAASLDFLFVNNGAPSQSLIIPLRFISRGARAIRRLTKRFDLPRIQYSWNISPLPLKPLRFKFN